MKRSQMVNSLAARILQIERPHPVRIAIDGVDAAGKTTLAEELAASLKVHGRPVIRASIDGFHNPARVRYERGKNSPEGYFYDSFNTDALIESLLSPLGLNGSRQYCSVVFDYRANAEAHIAIQTAEANAILLFDGVFLLRSELAEYWDFTIFVESSFEITLARAERRDAVLFGSGEEVRRRYRQRYIPGQMLYLVECCPQERAQVIVDNNDPQNPIVL